MSHDDYTIVLRKEESAGEWAWVARVPELPGCVATEETPEAALEHIKQSIKAYIEDQTEAGREVPPPSAQASGRFTVRVPRWVHRELKLQADAEGISLNQHVSAILSYWASQGQPPVREHPAHRFRPTDMVSTCAGVAGEEADAWGAYGTARESRAAYLLQYRDRNPGSATAGADERDSRAGSPSRRSKKE